MSLEKLYLTLLEQMFLKVYLCERFYDWITAEDRFISDF